MSLNLRLLGGEHVCKFMLGVVSHICLPVLRVITMPLEESTLVCDILDDGITTVMRTMYAGITLRRYIHCGGVTPGEGYYVYANISHLGSTPLFGVCNGVWLLFDRSCTWRC